MHTLILSPGDNTIDLADYTRESMKALEERLGHNLDWYATTHENTDHYHAHVVIAGRIQQIEHERQGRSERASVRNKPVGAWTNEEKDLRELLGHLYDERPVTDPREDRREERKFGSGSGARADRPESKRPHRRYNALGRRNKYREDA